MDAALSLNTASPIRYALTPRPASGGGIDIVLDLFRGAVPAHSRTVACVKSHELAPVVLACRRYLERRGARAVRTADPTPAPAADAPVAAFDWMFAS